MSYLNGFARKHQARLIIGDRSTGFFNKNPVPRHGFFFIQFRQVRGQGLSLNICGFSFHNMINLKQQRETLIMYIYTIRPHAVQKNCPCLLTCIFHIYRQIMIYIYRYYLWYKYTLIRFFPLLLVSFCSRISASPVTSGSVVLPPSAFTASCTNSATLQEGDRHKQPLKA